VTGPLEPETAGTSPDTGPRSGAGLAARGLLAALWVVILLVTAGVRLPAALAGRPYISYVDEGNYLHRVIHLLASRGWDTEYYLYPTVPMYSVAGAAWLYSPIYRAIHGHPLAQDLSPDPPSAYDVLEPPEVLYLGRAFALVLSLGIVVLTGALASRLAGPRAGVFAAWLAALTPALVIRGGVANVDIFATFFVLAALLAAERLRESEHPGRMAVLAGALIGLAATSKYTAALVCLPVALAVLLSAPAWVQRLRLLALAAGASALAAVIAMPALVLRTGTVLRDLHTQDFLYSTMQRGSYWHQAFVRAEWDQPIEAPELGFAYTALAALGLLVALAERRQARAVAGWLLLAGAFGIVLAPYPFRPFRNLLPVVPLLAVLTAFLYARLRRAATRAHRRTFAAGLAVDLAAALLPLVLFGSALYAYDAERLRVQDSRTLAVRWLAAHTRPGDAVLVASELMFLPIQLDTLQATKVVTPWASWRQLMYERTYRFAVIGNFALPGPRLIPLNFWRTLHGLYEFKDTFGLRSGLSSDSFYVSRGNRQPIFLLERRPGAAAPMPLAAAAGGGAVSVAPPRRSPSLAAISHSRSSRGDANEPGSKAREGRTTEAYSKYVEGVRPSGTQETGPFPAP
jgi:hypothetical protein